MMEAALTPVRFERGEKDRMEWMSTFLILEGTMLEPKFALR